MPLKRSDSSSRLAPGKGWTWHEKVSLRDIFPVPVHVQRHRGDFQEGVTLGVEAGGLDIDDDGQKTAKTL